MTLGFSTLIAACGTSTPVSNGIATMTPSSAETAVTNAIKAASSVRMVITVVQNGVKSTQTLDAAKTGGIRTLQVPGGTATILVSTKGAYLKAPSTVLSNNFGLSKTVAAKDSGQWLSFPSGTSGYYSLANGIGMAALAQEVALTSVKRKTHPQINGQAVTTLEGSSPSGVLDLYIPDSGQLLPLAGSINVKGSVVTFAFSRWGETVNLAPPANSHPFALSSTPPAASNNTSSAAG